MKFKNIFKPHIVQLEKRQFVIRRFSWFQWFYLDKHVTLWWSIRRFVDSHASFETEHEAKTRLKEFQKYHAF